MPKPANGSAHPSRRVAILSFTTNFPRPDSPYTGIFVHSRLAEIARLAPLRVVAPVAWIQYGNAAGRIPRGVPARRTDSGLEIRYPRWFYLPGIAPLTPFFLALCCCKSVWTESFDVLDSHFAHPDGIAAGMLAALKRRPFTITLRGNEVEKVHQPLVGLLMRWAFRRAARIITVSERLRQFVLTMGVDAGRVVTIPNGINPDIFFPRDRDACRSKIGMMPGAYHILSVGNVIPLKGHHHAIEAVARMRGSGLDVHLWIVGKNYGDPVYPDQLRELARRLNLGEAVRFVPGIPQDSLAEYMSAADLLCLASRREGWPNVVHEALACGCPVVSSDVGGAPDMLASRQYGILVPTLPEEEFPRKLEAALREAAATSWDRDAISVWGHARTWGKVAAETLAQLEIAARQ